jgi:hypothetical protein
VLFAQIVLLEGRRRVKFPRAQYAMPVHTPLQKVLHASTATAASMHKREKACAKIAPMVMSRQVKAALVQGVKQENMRPMHKIHAKIAMLENLRHMDREHAHHAPLVLSRQVKAALVQSVKQEKNLPQKPILVYRATTDSTLSPAVLCAKTVLLERRRQVKFPRAQHAMPVSTPLREMLHAITVIQGNFQQWVKAYATTAPLVRSRQREALLAQRVKKERDRPKTRISVYRATTEHTLSQGVLFAQIVLLEGRRRVKFPRAQYALPVHTPLQKVLHA